ncbi:MAG TPA: pyruvate kinase [Candidatus Acidoferrales bacterium]|nr:pyruvate kinase [Candidatus Acidoferrales bacterium]
MRKAKIVATIGPASRDPLMLLALLEAGMDAARLNFSHGEHKEHAAVIRDLRKLTTIRERSLAILADLPGPKIRTGKLQDGKPVTLESGQKLTLTGEEIVGNAKRLSINYPHLAADVAPGNRILLADGLIELRVLEKKGKEIVCRVVNGGELGERKGVNLPGARLRISSVTPRDKEHVKFVLEQRVNYIAQSFVRSADDVRELKEIIRRAGSDTPVIAKIEKPEALEHLEEILEVADGVMVARGDLGVEMNPEQVPVAQKRIISLANQFRKPVITATQMLESMIQNPRPTRAEASDVANAIFDGTDAVMLSGESASGRYPREAVGMMARIIREVETVAARPVRRRSDGQADIAETVADTVAAATEHLHLRGIAVFTESGSSARLVSKARPAAPIVAFSPNQDVRRRLALLWGVLPRRIKRIRNVDHLFREAEARLRRERLVAKGDIIAIVAGTPLGARGTTNMVKFHVVGS